MQRVAEMSTPLPIIDESTECTSVAKAAIEGTSSGTTESRALPRNNLMVSEDVTNLSEIPCRVSSDLHEWRNESATVLPTDTANL